MDDQIAILSPQDSLVAIMISISMSDENIRTSELITIQQVVNHLPIFSEYNSQRIRHVAEITFGLFEEEDGLDSLFKLVKLYLPYKLYETAYALACDVAAADGKLEQPELRLLEEIRYELNIDRLNAVAIEVGARARHTAL
jgi:tellurite resistance protein